MSMTGRTLAGMYKTAAVTKSVAVMAMLCGFLS
jgi:hypothetical protein